VLASSTPKGAAVNFAVRSRDATAMSLCLARNQPGGKTGYLEASLHAWNDCSDSCVSLTVTVCIRPTSGSSLASLTWEQASTATHRVHDDHVHLSAAV